MIVNRREFLGMVLKGSAGYFLLSSSIPLLPGCGAGKGKRRTYLIALDGMPRNYLGAKDAQGNLIMPNLNSLLQEGVSFNKGFSELPALTIGNHTAIITGSSIGDNGIYGAGTFYLGLNDNHESVYSGYAPEDIQTKTAYQIVKEAVPGSVTAVVSGKGWVGKTFHGQYCDVMATGPDYPDYVKAPGMYVLGGAPTYPYISFRFCLSEMQDALSCPPGTLPGGLLGTTPTFMPSDQWVLDAVRAVIDAADPDFIYILFAGPDDAGHMYGNFIDPAGLSSITNPEGMEGGMRNTDRCVGEFIQFLKDSGRYDNSVLVVTADHGMATIGIDPTVAQNGRQLADFMSLLNINSPYCVDIRAILSGYGLDIQGGFGQIRPYNSSGAYEACFTEGPNAYIWGVENGSLDKIVSALDDYNQNQPDNPIEGIIYGDSAKSGSNPASGFPYSLYNQACVSGQSRVKWPDLWVFLKRNYSFAIYLDTLMQGAVVAAGLLGNIEVIKGIAESGRNLALIPGLHGSYSDQEVPLILTGPGVPKGVQVEQNVSTLQILPTLCELNRWKKPEGLRFESLLKAIS